MTKPFKTRVRSLFCQKPGFLLLEVAVTLMILGPLVGLGFHMVQQYVHVQQLKTTKENQKIVLEALAAYLRRTHSLPCPAPTKISPDKAPGVAREDCIKGSVRLLQGLVPFRTLGLPESVAKDGYGFWMTYAVDPHLTTIREHLHARRGYCRFQFSPDIKPLTLEVYDHGKSVYANRYASLIPDSVVIVLISHGPTGGGSPVMGKSLQHRKKFSTPPTTCQKQNADNDAIFCSHPADGDRSHHDIMHVVWKTRYVFAQEAGISCFPGPRRLHDPNYKTSHDPFEESMTPNIRPPEIKVSPQPQENQEIPVIELRIQHNRPNNPENNS